MENDIYKEYEGKLIKFNDNRYANYGNTYRIIRADKDSFVICKMNTTKFELDYCNTVFLLESIKNKKAILFEDEFVYDFHINKLSVHEREKFEKKKAIINEVIDSYAPIYTLLAGKRKKYSLNEIAEKYSIPKSTLWRWIRVYFQSGFQDGSLVDVRSSRSSIKYQNPKSANYTTKTGRKSNNNEQGIIVNDEVKMQFEEFYNLYLTSEKKTYKSAYQSMLWKYYSTTINDTTRLKPENERPTYRQFYYYCYTHSKNGGNE